MPKVSIIVPVYNVQDKVGWCINSILKQTYRDIELILVNDGSTDDSLRILKNYERLDDRVKVIDIPNGGVSNARNIGIKYAQGEYLQFVDSDDVVDTEYTKTMLQAMESHHADSVVCSVAVKTMLPSNKILHAKFSCEFLGQECMLEGQTFFRMLPALIWKSYTIESPVNKLYKKSVIMGSEPIRFRKTLQYGEDFLFNLEYFEKCEKVVFLSNLLYYYMIWPVQSLSKRYIPNLYQGQEIQLKKLRELLSQKNAITSDNECYIADYEVGQVIKSILSFANERCTLTEAEKKQQIEQILRKELVQNAFEKYDQIEPEYEVLVPLVKKLDAESLLEQIYTIAAMQDERRKQIYSVAPNPSKANQRLVAFLQMLQKVFKKGFIHKWAKITELNLKTVGLRVTLERMKTKVFKVLHIKQ